MPRAERADAARNRERVLAAAERLLERSTPERVTMEQVARAAGVGLETEVLADSLLAPLAPELYRYQREVRGLSQAEVARGLALLAARVLRPG